MTKGYAIDPTTTLMYLARILALALPIPLHETAHAYVSDKLGDPTAKNLGRISLNPIKHFDIIGAMFMIFVGFGWAKPVPVNHRFYTNKKISMALSSLAGPLSNFLLAYLFIVIYKVVYYTAGGLDGSSFRHVISILLEYMIAINITLAVFNLLPIPPLDGSRVFLLFLPERIYFGIMRYERYIVIVLFLLMSSGLLNGIITQLQISMYSLLSKATMYLDILLA